MLSPAVDIQGLRMDVTFLKWLLNVDIRAKNATSTLVALVAVVVAYFILAPHAWFQGLTPWAQVASLVIVLLITFLTVWLLWSGAHAVWNARAEQKRSQRAEAGSHRKTREVLDSLTDWQRRFLLRFVVEKRSQIPEWEVGGFQAVWDAEMEVLQRKGIIISHPSGMYEIRPNYLAYLRENWNPDTGELS